ncbi:MAG: hypothetical protein ACYTG3_02355 [Planctomycetota bacterium]|jgi:hypothetical protein
MTTPRLGWLRPLLYVLALLGAVAFVVGVYTARERAWHNLLLHNFYFLSLSMMGAVFIAVQYLAKAGWPTLIRRVPEAMVAYLPAGGALMLLLGFGASSVYHWAHPGDDAILEAKAAFLNPTGFLVRMVVVLALWLWLARRLVRYSRRQDATGAVGWTHRSVRASAIFIVVFALTFSLAAIDWVMSLEPHWYSTLFPWYVMSSVFVAAVALIAVLVIVLRKHGHLPGVNRHHLHDLGKYIFAFSVFWGYLWFSQYMLIWYANIPEETTHYVQRQGGWHWLFWVNLGVNLFVPLLCLLPLKSKQNDRRLLVLSLIVIAGHWLDIYLLVMPSLLPAGPSLGWLEVCIGLGVVSLFFLFFHASLRRAPLVPAKDPYFEESLNHHAS